ncbi:hypothetical protein A3Q56_00189 [Intoshia linei]|uniref:Dynactin subunit 2 n=1 Tax=Intoshia linei TaxID=1819745 RepID=A0A177BCJ0_9BILA|nr:hypothetical protein A3Q56_00189 [Intoshia linei]
MLSEKLKSTIETEIYETESISDEIITEEKEQVEDGFEFLETSPDDFERFKKYFSSKNFIQSQTEQNLLNTNSLNQELWSAQSFFNTDKNEITRKDDIHNEINQISTILSNFPIDAYTFKCISPINRNKNELKNFFENCKGINEKICQVEERLKNVETFIGFSNLPNSSLNDLTKEISNIKAMLSTVDLDNLKSVKNFLNVFIQLPPNLTSDLFKITKLSQDVESIKYILNVVPSLVDRLKSLNLLNSEAKSNWNMLSDILPTQNCTNEHISSIKQQIEDMNVNLNYFQEILISNAQKLNVRLNKLNV